MQHNELAKTATDSLCLDIGPLHYAFIAYDAWGEETLEKIRHHIATTALHGIKRVDRWVHLVRGRNHITEFDDFHDILPQELFTLSWQHHGNPVNTLWLADGSRQVVWSASSGPEIGSPRFDLPWSLLIMDMASINGGLAHAGLACHKGTGLLFLAPPAGGKTTTLNSAPPEWQVLSDDAALVWPDCNSNWQASPLPAWGMITNPERDWDFPLMRLDQACRLKGLLVLHKANRTNLARIEPSTALPHVYRALSEYPVTILTQAVQPGPRFATAASMCRALGCWDLSLPLNGDIWPLVTRQAA